MSDNLRAALKDLKAYCSKYVDGDGSEDEQLAYDDIHIQLSQILAAHPDDPARPQPTLDRYRVMEVLKLHTIECTGPGEVTCRACRDKSWMSWFEYRRHIAAELETLVRPLPTREQIAEALAVCTCKEGHNQHGYWRKIDMDCPACGTNEAKADAVLALMGGTEEETKCTAEHPRGFGRCVFVAGHHYEAGENWTPHADSRGRSWNSQPAEDGS
jgi:hypothetical protein